MRWYTLTMYTTRISEVRAGVSPPNEVVYSIVPSIVSKACIMIQFQEMIRLLQDRPGDMISKRRRIDGREGSL